MPVDLLEISKQIKEIDKKALPYQQEIKAREEEAFELLKVYDKQLELLKKLVSDVSQKSRNLRCAVPGRENLCGRFTSQPVQSSYSILGADGSQINPSRHDAIPFGVINIGAIEMRPNETFTPREYTDSTLLVYDDVFTENGLLSERDIALIRDFRERQLFAELVTKGSSMIALTDGPLEPYHEQKETKTYNEYYPAYLESLNELHDKGTVLAGYVDKPFSDLVVRLLELTQLKKEDYEKASSLRKFNRINDRQLFLNILKPGERSAIFSIQSSSDKLSAELTTNFFYFRPLNAKDTTLARVEIPAWIADKPDLLNLLQNALNEQCAWLGEKAYPYILHRAHEKALVSREEKANLENRLMRELLNFNIPLEESSQKQSTKDLSQTRTRYT